MQRAVRTGGFRRRADYRVVSLVLRPHPHRLRRLAAASGLLVLVLALAAGAAGRPPGLTVRVRAQASEGCAPGALAAGDHVVHLEVGDLDRQALVHVPVVAAGTAVPLLLAFHGAGASGSAMASYSGFSRLADRAGFAVVYPSAAGPRHVWEVGGREDEASPNDLAFTRQLIDLVESRVCTDARRVSAVGVSNGGGFVARLGCVLSDRLAGIAVVAGGFSTLPACSPARSLSVMEIHGTDDPVVPYGGRHGAGSVPGWLAGWRARDGCPARPHQAQTAARVRRFVWVPCQAGTVVVHLRISGGKHQWPGATPADAGPPSTISASDETWRFLTTRRLTPASG